MPVYNFSSGPATLPESVLRTAQQEMLDYNGTGISVMTMSHRSDAFLSILHHAEQDLRSLMNIPSNYKILFLQGGALAQFTQVALNLAQGHQRADAVVTGNWSRIAAEQMGKLSPHLNVHIAAHGGEQFNYTNLPAPETWDISPQSAFVHYVINETVNGVQYHPVPKLGSDAPPVVCDFSSEILSRPIDVSDFGVIYAGAQKNIGMAGATVVIIREDLLQRCTDRIPNVWNYQVHLDRNGMYNTPCTYAIYIAGLVFRWLQTQGGVAKIAALNERKAALLYQTIDQSGGFYRNPVAPEARSRMNVIFSTGNPELDARFVQEAVLNGMQSLAGYKTLGGMRASIYNAMPLAGVETLASFMREFQRKNG